MTGSLKLLLCTVLLAACATTGTLETARQQLREGRGEEALATLEQAATKPRAGAEVRNEYFRQREILASQWLSQAENFRAGALPDAADVLYRRVLRFDPENGRAKAGLAQLETDERHRRAVAEAEALVKAEKFAQAQSLLRPVLEENPRQREARRLLRLVDERLTPPAGAPTKLRTTLDKPLTLELRDVALRSVFDMLQNVAGVGFVFDKDVRGEQRVTVAVRDATLEDALQAILLTQQLEHKVMNETTLLIYPATPQKRREYQELVVKSFYLTNADARQTANLLRTVVKSRDIYVDEKLNMLVLKDTPASLRLAERLIAAQDLADPEVMLEVEVLEVSRNRMLDLGVRFPQTIAWSLVGAAGTPGVVTLKEWLGRSSGLVQLGVTDPLFLLSLRQEDGSTNMLANPRIRVLNREKARVHIGDRVPVITTTAAATGGFISESVNYLDVGLKLEVEPLIHLDDDIAIKVGLEVSNIVREVKGTGSNTLTYQIGTRNASTVLRLRDGETQVLAGLISDEDRRTANRVPGLGSLPVLGRLFSHTSDVSTKTEVVLLITPRLLRTLARPDARLLEIPAGTEAASSGATGSSIVPPPPPAMVTPPAGTSQPPRTATPPSSSQPPAPPLMQPFGGVKTPP